MKKIFISFLLVFIAVGCAQTEVRNELEDDRAEVAEVESRGEMIQEVRSTIKDSDELTQQQKDQFISLHEQMINDVAKINKRMRQEKVVLFQAMFAQEFDKDKVYMLRKSMKKLHQAKFDIMMDALNESKDILGIAGPEIYERMRDGFYYR